MQAEQAVQKTSRLHPLVAGAAGALIIASAVAVAALTGVLPGSKAEDEAPVGASMEKQAAEKQTAATHPAPAKPASQKTQVAAAKPAKPVSTAAACANCGVIVQVKEVDVPGKGTGVGAVAGGVAGAVLGHEIGESRTGTAIGAVVGSVAGHQVERQARMYKRYDIVVRMSDGSMRNLSSETPPLARAGDKVQVLADGTVKPLS